MLPAPPFAHITHRKDAFSGAYIRAVCAVAGCGCDPISLDNDKVDYTVTSRAKGRVFTKPKIDIQAKCTHQLEPYGDGDLAFTLDVETYENLRDTGVCSPRYLVVLVVPEDITGWIYQTPESLTIRHCAYWISLKGMAETTNATSQTIHIPRKNVFTPTVLEEMMKCASDAEDMK